jgi:hypothetical protein
MEAPKIPPQNNMDADILSRVDANPLAPTAPAGTAQANGTAFPTGTMGLSGTTVAPGANGATVTDNTKDAVNNIKDAFANITSTNESLFYLIIIVFLVAVIVAYFLYYVIMDSILFQQKIDVDGTDVPIICNELTEFKITKSLTNSNGIKRSYGFWIYINDIDKYSGNFRHIAHLGGNQSPGQIKDACPYIFLDKHSNKIHVRFSPKNDSLLTNNVLNDYKTTDDLFKYTNSKTGDIGNCGITISYVPIQRWVHIVIVVSDANGGIVYTYIDGELTDQSDSKSPIRLKLHEIGFDNKTDTLVVGGSISNSTIGASGFSGLLSKFSIYNYDLNKNDIYKEYSKGPLNGLLTSMGSVSYGLRNPIYKLNSVQ